MKLYVGTSGYSYGAWKGRFYPERFPAARMLAYYGERLNAVEINSSFYRLPTERTLERWADDVGADFRFALKAPRRITHERRLAEAGSDISAFFHLASLLGQRWGTSLFQLPPSMKKDVSSLQAFLEALPASVSVACEFRHISWFDDAVLAILQSHGCALCITDSDEQTSPWVATAPFGYLRLRKSAYADNELIALATRIREQGWRQSYVFFRHEDEARGPILAERFRHLAEREAP